MRTFLLLILAALALGGCGGGDDDGGPVGPDLSAAELTARGWTAFVAGDLAAALADFDAAVARDANLADAHVGQGWARLSLATSPANATAAAASFTAAIAAGATGADARGGRAAAYLAAGGASLPLAAADAAAARQGAPAFVFAHRASFDVRDLSLIEAFARAGGGDLDAALAAADAVTPSGIDPGAAGTWTVDGATYGTYGGAVLAFLTKLSNQFAG